MFSGRLVSAVTGIIFTFMMVTRLGTSGYGTVEVIVTILTFASFPVGTIAYWVTRDVARGKMVGRTALVSSVLLSGLGIFIYFAFTVFTYSTIAASLVPFLLGALLVPLSYWGGATSAVVTGYRPSAYGYSIVVSELAKIGIAYEALYVYRLGINGAILALLTSYFVQALAGTYLVRVTTENRFDPAEVKRWTRLSWLPALSYLPSSLAVADSLLVALVLHGTSVVGTYQVAFTLAQVVTYATSLIFAMYPLLLQGGDRRLPAVSLEYSMLFALPMAAGCIALAGPILFQFGPNSILGTLGLSILAFMFLFNNISLLLDQTLMGTEKVDLGETPSFWRLVRSNLLFVPIANIAYGISYLAALLVAMSYSSHAGFGVSAEVAIWAAVQLVATFAFVLVKARRARGVAHLIPSISFVYYLASASIMAVAVYAAAPYFALETLRTATNVGHLIVLVAFGAAIYFGLVYALDAKFRGMAHSVLRRI